MLLLCYYSNIRGTIATLFYVLWLAFCQWLCRTETTEAEISVNVDANDAAALQQHLVSLLPGASELGHPQLPKAGTPQPQPLPQPQGPRISTPKSTGAKPKAKSAPVKQVGFVLLGTLAASFQCCCDMLARV